MLKMRGLIILFGVLLIASGCPTEDDDDTGDDDAGDDDTSDDDTADDDDTGEDDDTGDDDTASPPTDGLVAHYAFDGDANDQSGNGNHGEVNGPTLSEGRFGDADGAYSFDGVDDYISVPNSNSLQSPDAAVTIAAWVYIDQWDDGWASICLKSDTEDDGQYGLQVTDEGRFEVYVAGDCTAIYTDLVFTTASWFFVAMTWDGTDVIVYVAGEPEATEPFSPAPQSDNHPLRIGQDLPGSVEYLNGRLDDLRVYDRALSADEVRVLFLEGD